MDTSARATVERYNYELWNAKRFDLVDDLLAETMVRHEIGGVTTLTREQARERVVQTWAAVERLEFVLHRVIVDGEHVCIVYTCHAKRPGREATTTSSVEVFRVVDGRICEVWNMPYVDGAWL